jgi:phosphatidate cytidylyltransferase
MNTPFVSRSSFDALTVDDVEDSDGEQQEEEVPQEPVTRFVSIDLNDLPPT